MEAEANTQHFKMGVMIADLNYHWRIKFNIFLILYGSHRVSEQSSLVGFAILLPFLSLQ